MQRRILWYALFGFGLGAIFPVVGTLFQLSITGTRLSLDSVLSLHANRPIILLIDVIPLVLASSFALIGLQSARINQQSDRLQTEIQKQSTQIQNEHYFLEALIDSSSFAVVRLDTDHSIITCNPAFESLFGYELEEIQGRDLDDLLSSEDFLEEASQMSSAVSAGTLVRKISKRKKKDGSLIDLEIVGIPVTVAGTNIGILGLYHDISQRKEAEAALRQSEARYKSLFNRSPISLWEEDFSEVKKILDQIGDPEQIVTALNKDDDLVKQCVQAVKVLDVNQATLELFNASSKNEFTEGLSEIFVTESLDEFRKEIIALVNGDMSYECEIFNRKLTGELIYGWLKLSITPGYEESWEQVQISILDITERKEAEEKLRFMSFHDGLTGLFNRAYFDEELIRLSGSRQYPVSIVACDLDGLKQINDKYGHDTGDKAIKAAAKILGTHTFRKEDVVARIGGDEFVIILPSVDLDDNPSILDRIKNGISAFNNSSLEDDLFRPISISLGYAVVHKGEDLHEGYKIADKAMYKAKSRKKDHI